MTFLTVTVGICLIPILLSLALYIYFLKSYTYWEKKGVPTPDIIFPYGNAKPYVKKQFGYGEFGAYIYNTLKAKTKSFGGFYIFQKKGLMIIDPNLAQTIMTKDFAYFHDRKIYHDEENDPLSANLISLTGSKWKRLRTKVSPTFSPGKIKTMFPLLLASGKEMINVFEEKVNKDEPVNIHDMMSGFTIDNIGSCAFGLECNSIKNPESEFARYGKFAVETLFSNSAWSFIALNFPFVMKTFRIPLVYKEVTKFFTDIIQQTVDYREKNNVNRNDFMDMLIKLKNKQDIDGNEKKAEDSLTFNEIVAQSYAFFIGGFETSGITLTFTLYELCLNQDIQNKLRNEIISVLQKHGGEVTYDAIMEMNYLDKVVSETLRKYPPIPNINRKCTKTYQVPGTDVIIDKDVHCWISIMGIQRDPEYYPDPEKFDPERFSEEEISKRHPYTYFPFGEGPRICIGMKFGLLQTKVGLVQLLKKFKFNINSKTKYPLKLKTVGVTLIFDSPLLMDVTNAF